MENVQANRSRECLCVFVYCLSSLLDNLVYVIIYSADWYPSLIVTLRTSVKELSCVVFCCCKDSSVQNSLGMLPSWNLNCWRLACIVYKQLCHTVLSSNCIANACRTLDIKEKKHHIPVVDRVPAEPPPVLVAIIGPPKVGKSTLLRCLVKNFTRQKVVNIKGPITVVSGTNSILFCIVFCAVGLLFLLQHCNCLL